MASSFSFDVVSDFDYQEMVNVIDQTKRDVSTRYDLKDTKTEIELEKEQIEITTASEMSWDAIKDILETKAVRRNLSLKIFEYGKLEDASGMRKRIVIKLKKGLNQELAKEISKLIRDNSKAIPQIQGDTVRVTSKSKDELQGIMQLLKGKDFPAALQFTNYRQ
ncbi:MAG: YajQ family cyclic di-GMP-binding protein [Chloroflexi bacterium]|uniref:Nucleotide-binding protein HXX08_03205 n=1 Tax=Candidatus Chlorohelix allophototropha TaxID=3003348 RepID=A0A8T7LVF4_9CHLR|nr:YajQ family cyclic di-GMP-binding protein [Chloroflexota bacterium]WJW66745.1 YajQ family cyclic di-GMP-binding protein [Chloroflexota bacterium L227-S17]